MSSYLTKIEPRITETLSYRRRWEEMSNSVECWRRFVDRGPLLSDWGALVSLACCRIYRIIAQLLGPTVHSNSSTAASGFHELVEECAIVFGAWRRNLVLGLAWLSRGHNVNLNDATGVVASTATSCP